MKKLFTKLSHWFLGFVIFLYGLTKFFRMQGFDTKLTGEISEVASDDLFWYFFGYSDVYLYYLGTVECLAGLLLFFERTKRLGLLMFLILLGNITLMDFVYNIGPVKYWATFLTIYSAALILLDIKPYERALLALCSRNAD